MDSQQPGSRSMFLPRLQDDKLRLQMDVFRFAQEERSSVSIVLFMVSGRPFKIGTKTCIPTDLLLLSSESHCSFRSLCGQGLFVLSRSWQVGKLRLYI